MSKAGRLGLVALAVAVAVVAFLIARPDDDEGKADSAPAADTSPTATAPSAPEPPPDAQPPQKVETVELTDHAVEGGAAEIKVTKGERVAFVVDSDEPDEIHVHGYDIEREVAPGKPAHFSFKADIEGIFEIESHEAEHQGLDALIAKLVVEPS